VGLVRGREPLAHEGALPLVLPGREAAAHQLEAQVDEEGVDDVGLAVVADVVHAAGKVCVPDALARHAELAREAEQLGHPVEAHPPAHLEAREHVHEVHVAPVEAADVVVPAERRVLLARLPVASRLYAVAEAPVMQYRQVESAAVPADERRAVALDAVEEAPHEL